MTHFIGFCGMVCVVLCYYNITRGIWDRDDYRYNGINLLGAILLIISLCVHFNLGSFVIEIFWVYISGTALWQKYKSEKRHG